VTGWRGPRAVRADWAAPAGPRGHPDRFDPGMVADLPEPARRWLLHALAPGTQLVSGTGLTMHGTIRLGAWRRFTARQVLRPPDGYIWAATAHVFGVPVTGYDRFSSGTATMRWRLLGVLPVVTADGADVARSAAGTAHRGGGARPDGVPLGDLDGGGGPGRGGWHHARGRRRAAGRGAGRARGKRARRRHRALGRAARIPVRPVPVRGDRRGGAHLRRSDRSVPVPGRLVVGY
jgi:hypothetical protein